MPGKRKKKAPATPARRKKVAARPRSRQVGKPRAKPPAPDGVITIRKYSNRRLYDTVASSHITQEDLYHMVSQGAIVRILDASTGEDITNQTLAMALIEHDPGKLRLMPAWLLHQMIRLHEQAIGGWLSTLWPPLAAAGAAPIPSWTGATGVWPGGTTPMGLGAWSPWATPSASSPQTASPQPQPPPRTKPQREESLDELRREVANLLRRLSEQDEPR